MTETTTSSGDLTTTTGPNWGLTKFLDPLRIPAVIKGRGPGKTIAIEQVAATVSLHSEMPPTTMWTYNGHFPGPTIEVERGVALRFEFANQIDGAMPLVAVAADLDESISTPGYRDPSGAVLPGHALIDGVADLPGWTVTHLHGAATNGSNDGWPHNAGLRGTRQFTEYLNEQPACALWYHDHPMAVTRYSVHAGLAGMYLIRDEEEAALRLPSGKHEIPLVLTDRNFDTEPATGKLNGQSLFKVTAPDLDVVQFEFHGPFNLVNGVIWPHLDTQARWYRLRILNACNGRTYRLNLVDAAGADCNFSARLIGTDTGLLPTPLPWPSDGLVVGPAERFDVLVDFAQLRGKSVRLVNANLIDSNFPSDATIEPDVMEFRVEDRRRDDPFTLPAVLSASYVRLEHGTTVPEDHDHVWVALMLNPVGHARMWDLEELDADPGGDGIIQIADPATGSTRTFRRIGELFDDTTGVFIDHNRWAVWNFINVNDIELTHPMHIHLTRFQVLSRRGFTNTFDTNSGRTTAPLSAFTELPLPAHEIGWKDTVLVNTAEWVSVVAKFDGGTGEYVFHCHILDHEDTGMMRPFVVHPPEVARFHEHHGHGHPHMESKRRLR